MTEHVCHIPVRVHDNRVREKPLDFGAAGAIGPS
jgi:hypothetical protein